MSAAAVPANADADKSPATPSHQQSARETVESVIVAFILAFLFRAFVAEAFVIPTGSMAPTLMGAHKDVFCEYCGQQYQANASREFDANTGAELDVVSIASTCSTCRGLNAYDLRKSSNASFSGDRILVSKFDYVLSRPERWDVFVFKFPAAARMNYIKRLVGLPGESLLIEGGDVYTKPASDDQWTIARKPPTKIRAMRQVVSDTKYQAPVLIEKGWPSLWQPTPSTEQSQWQVDQDADSWAAELNSSSEVSWLRYYHKFLDDANWQDLLKGGNLPKVDPHDSQLITDYLAYNSSYHWMRDRLYDNGGLRDEIDDNTTALDLAIDQGLELEGSQGNANDGHHWVGDLVSEFEIEVASESGTLLLDLVEFGVHFQCAINVADGSVNLSAVGDDLPEEGIFSGARNLSGQSGIRGAGTYRLELANVDDQIVLWIDGDQVEFDRPAIFDSRAFRQESARRPYWSASDPMDAAPVGIGGQNLAMRVARAMVYRDIYYIAVQSGGFTSTDYSDYDLTRVTPLRDAIPDEPARAAVGTPSEAIAAVYSHPDWWSQSNLFSQRGSLAFELEDDQYFPMGDNSAASSDARAWFGHHYVERQFLLGKALLVFWPHAWNSPVPFTPNFARMGLIR